MVQQGLTNLLGAPLRLSAELGEGVIANEAFAPNSHQLAALADDPESLGTLLGDLGARIIVCQERITILLDPARLLDHLSCDGTTTGDQPIRVDIEVRLRRRGHELKLIYAAPEARPPLCDDRLIQLLGQARIAYRQLCAGTLTGSARSHAMRSARLCFLAPDIVTAILEGRQPVALNTRALLRVADLPIEWSAQRQALSFD